MSISVVSILKSEHDALLGFLLENEPSLALSTSQTLSKALLLAGASELEVDVVRIVVEYFYEVTAGNHTAVQFVESKALKRQYHTLFNWDGNNANTFFSLFGTDFKQFAAERVKEDEQLTTGIQSFLSLGAQRNQLIHGNFAAFPLTLTPDEIFSLYERACIFRDALPGLLRREDRAGS